MSEHVFPLLPGQRQFATRAQLVEAGWTPEAVRRLGAVHGQRVFRTVYAEHRGTLSDEDLLVAASLWAGRRAVLTGGRALGRYGLELPRPPSVTRFLVARPARVRSGGRGVLTVRTERLPAGRIREDVPTAPVHRALVDAARFKELSATEVKGLTLVALQQRYTTPDLLDTEIVAAGASGARGVREAVDAYRSGAWSLPEAVLVDLVASRPDLPVMLANPVLADAAGEVIGTPDGYFAEYGVVVQVHSKRHHSGTDERGNDRWAATVEGDHRYTRHGLVVVPVTPHTLAHGPQQFLSLLLDVLASREGYLGDVRVLG